MLERFLREARTASALNHPNICTIYEIDEHEGDPFIAMELLEGQALDRRIDGRPLDIDVLLDYAIQIADALEVAAHRAASCTATSSRRTSSSPTRGQVKVLDFGLAKSTSTDGDQTAMRRRRHSKPSCSTTRQGVTLGTVAYMSPEQARGEELDVRIGSVLVRRRALRDGHRPAHVPGQHVRGGVRRDSESRARGADRSERQRSAGAGTHHRPGAREGSPPSVSERSRPARRLAPCQDRARLGIIALVDRGLRRISSHSGASWPSATAGQPAVSSRLSGLSTWSALVAGFGVVCLLAAVALFVQSRNQRAEPAASAPATRDAAQC